MKIRYFFFVVVFIFTSCAPKPHRDDAVLKEGCDVGDVFAFEEGGWPESRWWEGFEDASLTALVDHALRFSPTLAQVEEKVLVSVSMALQERAHLFPEFGLELSDEWQHLAKEGFYRGFAPTVPAVVNDVKAGIGVWYVFDFWGKNRALVQAALGEVRAMRAERAQAELVLASSVTAAYIELQGYLEKLALMRDVVSLKEQIEDVHVRRKEHALDKETGVLASGTDVLSVRARVSMLEGLVAEKRHAVCALIGEGQSFAFDVGSLGVFDVGMPQGVFMDLIARRPDIAAQRARVEACADRVFVAKTEFYPNIDLAALIGWESIYIHQLFLSKNYSASIKPALHLPLFTAGRLQAQLDAAQAFYNEAVYVYNALIVQACREVADGLSMLLSLKGQIDAQIRVVESLLEVLLVERGRMEHGVGCRLAVLEEEVSLLEARYVLIDLESSMRLWRVFLVRALGGGYVE